MITIIITICSLFLFPCPNLTSSNYPPFSFSPYRGMTNISSSTFLSFFRPTSSCHYLHHARTAASPHLVVAVWLQWCLFFHPLFCISPFFMLWLCADDVLACCLDAISPFLWWLFKLLLHRFQLVIPCSCSCHRPHRLASLSIPLAAAFGCCSTELAVAVHPVLFGLFQLLHRCGCCWRGSAEASPSSVTRKSSFHLLPPSPTSFYFQVGIYLVLISS